MLRMFGLGEGPVIDGGIGWGKEQSEQDSGAFNVNILPADILRRADDLNRKLKLSCPTYEYCLHSRTA